MQSRFVQFVREDRERKGKKGIGVTSNLYRTSSKFLSTLTWESPKLLFEADVGGLLEVCSNRQLGFLAHAAYVFMKHRCTEHLRAARCDSELPRVSPSDIKPFSTALSSSELLQEALSSSLVPPSDIKLLIVALKTSTFRASLP